MQGRRSKTGSDSYIRTVLLERDREYLPPCKGGKYYTDMAHLIQVQLCEKTEICLAWKSVTIKNLTKRRRLQTPWILSRHDMDGATSLILLACLKRRGYPTSLDFLNALWITPRLNSQLLCFTLYLLSETLVYSWCFLSI